MSKAFTRESDDEGAELPTPRAQLPAGLPNQITAEGAEKLRRRLEELSAQKKALDAGSQQGGIVAAGEAKRLEGAIRRLKQVLDSVVVAGKPVDSEKVGFGATVVVHDATGEDDTYRFVGVDEADPGQGAISWLSPLARALMGRRAGETVTFKTPGGAVELRVMSVSY